MFGEKLPGFCLPLTCLLCLRTIFLSLSFIKSRILLFLLLSFWSYDCLLEYSTISIGLTSPSSILLSRSDFADLVDLDISFAFDFDEVADWSPALPIVMLMLSLNYELHIFGTVYWRVW